MKKQYQQSVILSDQPLDIASLVSEANANQGESAGNSGAVVTFTGVVRHATLKDPVLKNPAADLIGMTLEHYPGMTESQLQLILNEAHQRWHLNKSMVVHRVGYLTLGEPIVFIAVCSPHRKEAFEATQFIMDYLKQKATFWKKEHYPNKEIWVEAKQSDLGAAERW